MFSSLTLVTRGLVALVIAAMLWAGSGSLLAHEKIRIIGTVVKVQGMQLDVRAVDGQTYEIDMDAKTRVTRNKKAVAVTELEAGRSVVVDALGHDMFDLVAPYDSCPLARRPGRARAGLDVAQPLQQRLGCGWA